jgi:hypothetical protein
VAVDGWSCGRVEKVDYRVEVALHFRVLIVAAGDQQQAYPLIAAPGENFLRGADRYCFVVGAVYQEHCTACRADGVAGCDVRETMANDVLDVVQNVGPQRPIGNPPRFQPAPHDRCRIGESGQRHGGDQVLSLAGEQQSRRRPYGMPDDTDSACASTSAWARSQSTACARSSAKRGSEAKLSPSLRPWLRASKKSSA